MRSSEKRIGITFYEIMGNIHFYHINRRRNFAKFLALYVLDIIFLKDDLLNISYTGINDRTGKEACKSLSFQTYAFCTEHEREFLLKKKYT